ncbi:hypothetical protein LA080_010912 [Diaporthe eres]|nr:hypothetical protein LA080_010912 [Diaporthe eres]
MKSSDRTISPHAVAIAGSTLISQRVGDTIVRAEHRTHVHSTNTKITASEVVEKRTQAIVRRYATNHGSGGREEFNGGSGCTREFEARVSLKVSVLSDRRVFPPHGMHGGEPGSVGRNILFKWNDDHTGNEMINLGGKAEISLEPVSAAPNHNKYASRVYARLLGPEDFILISNGLEETTRVGNMLSTFD